jgi:hypothetical protein
MARSCKILTERRDSYSPGSILLVHIYLHLHKAPTMCCPVLDFPAYYFYVFP